MLRLLIRYPLAAILGIVLIALGGLASFRQMPVDLFPDLNYPLINIVTHLPAGTAEDMELLVTRPIENAMLGLRDLRRVRSVSAPGFSQVTVEFTWGTGVLQARQLVFSRLAQVMDQLPAGARPALENIGTSLAMVSTYTLSGAMDPVELRHWAQYEMAPHLAALPGVAEVAVMGGGQRAYRIDLDPLRLRQHHLSASAIAEAIRANHVLMAGGFLEQHGRDLLVRTLGTIASPQALKDISVAQGPKGPVLLRDVAEVYEGALPERYVITADRLPAVAFTIQKQPGASTLQVSRAVDEALARIGLPPGVKLDKFYDQAEIIGLAYRNMRDNLLMGAFLAILSLFWVLGRQRSTWVIAVTLPLAALGTFILMHGAGLGVNLMTLGALTVAIGLIDDDAIIVLENIVRHREMGRSPWEATLEGVREIIAPDVAGTLTVLAAFLPLVLLTGLAGRLFVPFGLTFSFMLLLSLLFSLTLIPVATAHWLPKARPRRTAGTRWIAWLAAWNQRLLALLLAHPRLTLSGAVLVWGLSLGLLVLNPTRFLPLLDEDSLLLSYQLAPGTSLRESDRFGDALEAWLLDQPGVAAVFRRTGSPESSFYVEGPDQGEIVMRLDPRAGLTATQVKQALERRVAALPGVLIRINEPTTEKLDESFSGLPALFGITVFGNDLKALHAAAGRIEEAARQVPGLANVVNNTKVPVDQVVVSIDHRACGRLGVSARAVAEAVRIALQGEKVAETVVGQQPIALFLRYRKADRDSLDKLGQVLVPGPKGVAIPLSQLARIHTASTYASIEHQFGTRALTLTAEITGNPYGVLRHLNQAIAALKLPPSIHIAYTGEYRQLLDTARQMLWILAIAAVLVYGIIAIQLGSLLDPAVVLMKLPIDFMGAALALFITRQSLDVTVFIGLITLVGVAMNNGIMLLTFVRDFRRQGMDAKEAVHQAVAVRIRPMLLSHMTTLLALIPAALGIGKGPQLLQPLGIMLFGGLTAGTLLTLNLLPVIYVATERWRRKPFKGASHG